MCISLRAQVSEDLGVHSEKAFVYPVSTVVGRSDDDVAVREPEIRVLVEFLASRGRNDVRVIWALGSTKFGRVALNLLVHVGRPDCTLVVQIHEQEATSAAS